MTYIRCGRQTLALPNNGLVLISICLLLHLLYGKVSGFYSAKLGDTHFNAQLSLVFATIDSLSYVFTIFVS